MCDKESYTSYKSARDAANGISKRTGNSARPYKCVCGDYHITTFVKNRLEKPKKDNKYPLRFERKKPEKFPEAKRVIGYHPEPVLIHEGKVFK